MIIKNISPWWRLYQKLTWVWSLHHLRNSFYILLYVKIEIRRQNISFTDSLPALVGLSDKPFEGVWIWDNEVLFNYLQWELFGFDFNGVDIDRPGVFCLNVDCGWIGVYRDIFMVWDNCCSKTSHWLCAYNPWTFLTDYKIELFL